MIGGHYLGQTFIGGIPTVGAGGSPPANTVAPVASGTASVGSTLSTTNGTWTGDVSGGFTYQWKDGAGNIGGATASTYTIGGGEVGATLHCTVTAHGAGGNTSADSNALGPVVGTAPPINVDPPAVTDAPTQGSLLATSNGSWLGSPSSYAYQWRRDGVAIGGATTNSYTSVFADVGHIIDVVVTATNGFGSTPASSNPIGPIGVPVLAAPKSARVLSAKALELLADLPPYLRDDVFVQAVINAQSNELQRIGDASQAILDGLFPSQANDVQILGTWFARLLSMWETMLGLPVAPPGVTLTERRSKVQAHIQARNSGAGSDWIKVLTQALGTGAWTHQEGPLDYTVTITIPSAPGSYSTGQVAAIARKITPAHLDVVVTSGGGFIVGVSDIGTDPL